MHICLSYSSTPLQPLCLTRSCGNSMAVMHKQPMSRGLQIATAYEVLSDPEKRRVYDQVCFSYPRYPWSIPAWTMCASLLSICVTWVALKCAAWPLPLDLHPPTLRIIISMMLLCYSHYMIAGKAVRLGDRSRQAGDVLMMLA